MTLINTRPINNQQSLNEFCKEQRIKVINCPLFHTVLTPTIISLDRLPAYNAVIITSNQALEYLNSHQISLPRSLLVLTVGNKLYQQCVERLENKIIKCGNNINGLIEYLNNHSALLATILYLRGAKISANLKELFIHKISIDEFICYHMHPTSNLTTVITSETNTDNLVLLPVFSLEAAKEICTTNFISFNKELIIIAFSNKIADYLHSYFKNIKTIPIPEIKEIFKMILQIKQEARQLCLK
ncbi:uroporphyrinogen-III synthase [Rickettsiales endosymbiont of Stachyamoeba lipophora]|uniref:uroporphyrinogen-III synthase n=1 Tax=Rickettsiales endosymbiont of Stachyamoeba lipophora TaxID=2486578 RepID=UPI0013DDA2E5|nr:uroporphyrinogen-III synthase [Rickettsiales endosymbiont of Stachyamoeba lipophora]